MDAGHSSDASTLPPLDGGVIDPGPASPAPLGAEWIAVGDSETDGRAEGSVLSQIIAFETVWNGTGELGAAPSLTIDGESGRALRASGFAYHGGTYDNCTGTGGDDQTIAGMGVIMLSGGYTLHREYVRRRKMGVTAAGPLR